MAGIRPPDGKRVLYLQFTNPAGYPPLEHSAWTLANRGWNVTFLGTGAPGEADSFRFPRHPNVTVRQIGFAGSRWVRKLQFLGYCIWTTVEAWRLKPDWIYASDALSTPAALLARLVTASKVLYNEQDTPPARRTWFQSLILRCRKRLASTAELCVLPNAARAESFKADIGTMRPVIAVWSCATREEATVPRHPSAGETVLFYHGSLNGERLPITLLQAMSRLPRSIRLRFAGFSSEGSKRFVGRFLEEANRLGLADHVSYIGALATRSELLDVCRQATIGISLVPKTSDDFNMRHMAGASSKTFDYMACGLALLISDVPQWTEIFAVPAYGLACDPGDVDSIEAALRTFIADPEATCNMGKRARDRVLSGWNYETQFAPVLATLEQA